MRADDLRAHCDLLSSRIATAASSEVIMNVEYLRTLKKELESCILEITKLQDAQDGINKEIRMKKAFSMWMNTNHLLDPEYI